MSDLILYTKTGCPYCEAAKNHFTDEGRVFTEFNISDSPAKKKDLLRVGNSVTVGFGGS